MCLFNRSYISGSPQATLKEMDRAMWMAGPGLREGAVSRAGRPPQAFPMSIPEAPALDGAPGDAAGGCEDTRTSGRPKHPTLGPSAAPQDGSGAFKGVMKAGTTPLVRGLQHERAGLVRVPSVSAAPDTAAVRGVLIRGRGMLGAPCPVPHSSSQEIHTGGCYSPFAMKTRKLLEGSVPSSSVPQAPEPTGNRIGGQRQSW